MNPINNTPESAFTPYSPFPNTKGLVASNIIKLADGSSGCCISDDKNSFFHWVKVDKDLAVQAFSFLPEVKAVQEFAKLQFLLKNNLYNV